MQSRSKWFEFDITLIFILSYMNTTRNTIPISKLHGIDVLTMMSHNVKICHVRTKCNNFSPLICKLMAAILDFKLIGVLKNYQK